MIPTWLYNKTIATYDLETDFIPTTEIFCNSISIITIGPKGELSVVPAKVYTQYWTKYTHGSLLESLQIINSCDYNLAHNGIGFDELEVLRHMGLSVTSKPLDTLIIGKLMFSNDDLMSMDPGLGVDKDLWGRYSLKAWGQRMGNFKIDFGDFTGLTREMTVYCNQDTDLTTQLLLHFLSLDFFPNENVLELEFKMAQITAQQIKHGFHIDIDKARELNTQLLKEKGEISRELLKVFKPKYLKEGPVKAYKKPSKLRKYLPNKNYKEWTN